MRLPKKGPVGRGTWHGALLTFEVFWISCMGHGRKIGLEKGLFDVFVPVFGLKTGHYDAICPL